MRNAFSPSAMARLYVVHYAPSCCMRIRMAVLRLLPLLRVPHMHEWLDRRVSFQWRTVVRMTNLCDGISKRFRRRRVTPTCKLVSLAFKQISSPLVHPFRLRFLSFVFSQNFTVRFLKPQQRVITRFCPTSPTVEATQHSHTTLLTTFLHSTNCQNFCMGSPQQQVSTSP